MKSRALGLVVLLVFCLPFATSADTQPPKKASEFIAVMDLRIGKDVDQAMVAPLTNVVIEELVRLKKFTVVDRANRDKILAEVGFQMTGCADESCTVEVGRLLGVGKIVVGSIDKIGETYLVSLQLIDVSTGAIDNMARATCKKCEVDALIDVVAQAARNLVGVEQNAPVNPGVVAPPPPTRVEQTPPPSSSSVEMVSVLAGEFMMGCNEAKDNSCQQDEKPYHKVILDAYKIDKFEVKVSDYEKCVSAGKCAEPSKIAVLGACNWGKRGKADNPINCVDFNHAKAYCEWVGKRLPTEAEWEKAARGTDGRIYPWGFEPPSCRYAIMSDGGAGCGKSGTWPVGSKPDGASPYGAMDMAGNVWEWTSDYYDANYYSGSPIRNPMNTSQSPNHALRGGGWPYGAPDLRVSRRHWAPADQHSTRRGFRCAM